MSEVIKLISTANLKTNKFLTGFWNWDYVLWHCTYLRKSGDFWQKPFWNLPHGRVLQVVWRSSLSGPLNAFPIMKECSRAGTYFNCIMFMVASSVVTTILVLNYHHRQQDTHEMPEWVTFFLFHFIIILTSQKSCHDYFLQNIVSESPTKYVLGSLILQHWQYFSSIAGLSFVLAVASLGSAHDSARREDHEEVDHDGEEDARAGSQGDRVEVGALRSSRYGRRL